jgi:hypothetical protein
LQEAARAAKWKSPDQPGKWVKLTRTFRDGSSEDWWALAVVTGLNAPDKPERVVIATSDPLALPDPEHVLLGDQSAGARIATGGGEPLGGSQLGGSGAALWAAHVGRTKL